MMLLISICILVTFNVSNVYQPFQASINSCYSINQVNTMYANMSAILNCTTRSLQWLTHMVH